MKLHLGCGHTVITGWKNMDISTSPNVSYIDLEKPLPFKDKSVDIVLMSHVLCLLKNKEQCVMEVKRILKKGGWFRLIDNPSRFRLGTIPTDADEHTMKFELLIEWLNGFDIYEAEDETTCIDIKLIHDFRMARAGHTSFIIEATKR